jgi:hypothetical protein
VLGVALFGSLAGEGSALPERAFSTLPSSVEVSGGTKRPRPPPMMVSCAPIFPIGSAGLDAEQPKAS